MHTLTSFYFFLSIFFLYDYIIVVGQTAQMVIGGTPFIKNFTPEEYLADPQNWFLAQDTNGIIYSANTLGLLKYDGTNWEKINMPNVIARSVTIGQDGKVYVGSQGDLGCLVANSKGEQEYQSLWGRIPEKFRNFVDVWSAYSTTEGVFFFTPQQIFLWQEPMMKVIKAPKKFKFCFEVNQQIYTQDDSLGLLHISTNGIRAMPNATFFLDKEIRSILPYQTHSLLITTLKHGLFVYELQSGQTTPLGSAITNNFLIENLVFCGKKLLNNHFAIGTFRSGLVILNDRAEIVSIINEEAGLRNNSIRQLWIDKHHGLWVALNNGISRIEVHSPFAVFDKRQGLRGSINAICNYNNQLLVGTSLGIFRYQLTSFPIRTEKFEQIAGFTDQAFHLSPTPYGLLIGSNTGSHLYSNDQKFTLLSPNAAFIYAMSQRFPHWVFVGLRDGIEVLVYDATTKHWKGMTNPFATIKGEVRSLVQDNNGDLWAATKTNGVFRIQLHEDIYQSKITNYTTKEGLLSMKQNRLNKNSTGICVGNPAGVVVYNTTTGKFEPHPQLQVLHTDTPTQEAWQLNESKEGMIWAWSERTKGVFRLQDGKYKWDSRIFLRIPKENIHQIYDNDQFVWIGSSNVLYRFDKRYKKNKNDIFSVLLRRIALLPQDSLIASSYYNSQESTRLHFKNNSLSFDFAATYFDSPEENQFQYQLEGYEKQWSVWTQATHKDYTNLWNGKYRLKVKAKNIYGEESSEKIYSFEILPPWYRTNLAYVSYALFMVLAVITMVRIYTQRLQLRNQLLEETVKLRTAEIQLQKEEIETQRDNLEHLNQEIALQKNKIEQSYHNIQLLSTIGTELTKIREVESIITTFYDSVNTLIDAPVFAVGMYNEAKNRLDFYSIEDTNAPLDFSYDDLDNTERLSVWCYKHNKEIFINNIEQEYHLYLTSVSVPVGKMSYAIMYVPLRINEKVFGVVTVQSFKKYAYDDYHRTIFTNLATYISIALDNANAYRTIAVKNQQIIDSIRYAETIQQAILPNITELQASFGTNYFVFYKAKDVVSGDFYWLFNHHKNPQIPINTTFIAVVDCTGHGVPGAFMSLIGATLLNYIVEQKQTYSPAHIIATLHEDIRKLLRQKDHMNRDGMDLALCKLERYDTYTQLTFSGAKRALLKVDNQQVLEQIKGTYKAVGGGHKDHIDFEESQHALQQGEMIYLTSDGYTDQNNANNDKFSIVHLKELLIQIAPKTIDEQCVIIKETFEQHKGKQPQRDDVTIMGIRIA